MKVLGLSCGRKMGNSEVLLREALMGAQEVTGAETELIRLFDLNIKPCLGCEKCVYDRFAGGDGGCIIKNDHVPFIMEKLAECDGFILSAPCYCSRPPAYLLMIQDRFLGVPVKYRNAPISKPNGVIAVGGSDMVGVMLPQLNRCPGHMNMKLVDQMMVIWTSRPDQVVLNDEAIARAHKLGANIGQAMKMDPDEMKYVGDAVPENLDDFYRSDYDAGSQITPFYETCPVCHSDLVRLRGKFVECPTCYMKGTIEVKDGVPSYVCDPINSPPPYQGTAGRKRHDDNGIMLADKLVQEKKREIKERMEKYRTDIAVIKPPPLRTRK